MNSPLYDQSAWQKIEPYFDQALDLDPSQRELWLTQFTTTHPEIATAVRELLVARDRLAARGFLENSAAANSALEELIGTSQTPTAPKVKERSGAASFHQVSTSPVIG